MEVIPAIRIMIVTPNHIHHWMKTTNPRAMTGSCKKCFASDITPDRTKN